MRVKWAAGCRQQRGSGGLSPGAPTSQVVKRETQQRNDTATSKAGERVPSQEPRVSMEAAEAKPGHLLPLLLAASILS